MTVLRRPHPAVLALLLTVSIGCGAVEPDSPAIGGNDAAASGASSTPPPPPSSTSAERPDTPSQQPGVLEALGMKKTGRHLPSSLKIGEECPAASGDIDAEMAAQAEARVPLKVGLTLLNLWNPRPSEEYECLTQVTAIHRDAIDMTMRCNRPQDERTILRRLCRSDLNSARMVHTGIGIVTVIGEDGEELPETVVGATEFSLSREEFRQLKSTGRTEHHYVQVNGEAQRLECEAKTTLELKGPARTTISINGQPTELPVLEASGDSEIYCFGKVRAGKVNVSVVDDERFPLFADYSHLVTGEPTPHFRLHFPKVTYPGAAEPERELAKGKRMIVDGIYFDFNSDRIRKESDPTLKELGDLLMRHPDWTLSINGHTDNVGGDAYNLRLSQRRAAAVVRWLVERHGIAPDRLRSAGFGRANPIESNDTPEGRARNRRVELVRVEDVPAEAPRQ